MLNIVGRTVFRCVLDPPKKNPPCSGTVGSVAFRWRYRIGCSSELPCASEGLLRNHGHDEYRVDGIIRIQTQESDASAGYVDTQVIALSRRNGHRRGREGRERYSARDLFVDVHGQGRILRTAIRKSSPSRVPEQMVECDAGITGALRTVEL